MENAPLLPPHIILWFRKHYLPNEEDWKGYDASPILAPDELFRKAPPAWIAVAEVDVVRDEGIAYAERLRKFGIPAEAKVYPGMPHIFPLLDGLLTAGAEAVTDAVVALDKAFGTKTGRNIDGSS
jgi:acetyl esterase/lipase